MKTRFRLNFLMPALSAALLAVAGCSDLSAIEERVDNLENRVEVLETLCKSLNENVVALQAFVNEHKSISSVSQASGIYTLTLSDGSTITLKAGTEGKAVMPVIVVDKDGYWVVNGTRLESNGAPVPAKGEDGATPMFGVDSEGYWTVKYSQEEAAVRVLDASGNPVKATIEGGSGETVDSFFKSVSATDDALSVVLKDGSVYSLPIVKDFLCAIKDAPAEAVIFNYSETKTYSVEEKNVASATIFAPKGWTATLEDAILSITAPAVLTKASADTRQDVAILAISSTGFSTIAKIKVQLSDKPIVSDPVAVLTLAEATETSLKFSVTASNSDKWYYKLLVSTESSPSPDELASGTESTDSEITLTEDSKGAKLLPNTQYTLYVLPMNGDKRGDVVSLAASTKEKTYASPYAKYMDGADIVIGEKTINKATYGEPVHITADNANITTYAASKPVYFIEKDANATWNYTGSVSNVILIGNDNNERVNLTFASQLKLTGSDANLAIISGMIINWTFDGYLLANNRDGQYGYVNFNNCFITPYSGKPLHSMTEAARSIGKFIMDDSEYCISKPAEQIFNVQKNTQTWGAFVLKNNIFYNGGNTPVDGVRLFNGGTNAVLTDVVMVNNTFVNLHPKTEGLVYAKSITTAECRNNLVFTELQMSAGGLFLRAGTFPTDGSKCRDNVCYKGEINSKYNWQICFGGYKALPGSEEVTIINDNPFTGGIFDVAKRAFVPTAAYAAYGAKRK